MNDLTLKDMIRTKKDQAQEAPAMDLGPIHALFDEKDLKPDVDETQFGRIKLLRALRQKFGAGYRSIPKVQDALDHYDKEVKFLNLYRDTMEARRGR